MNRTKILFSIAALLALAGCGKEPAPMGAEMTVEATLGAATKVSAGGDAFTAGDQIAVYAWTGNATTNPATRVVDGVVNTFDGTTWTPASPMLWKNAHDTHYFLGVYPASKAPGSDFTAVPYALTGSAAADDLLLATTPAGVKNTGDAVQLGFHHVMARLDVNLRFRNEWATAPTADHVSVSVEAKRSATVNYLTETVTASGAAGNVALAPATAATGYALGYSGLQVPQDGVRKITVVVDDHEYEFVSTTDIPLTSGKYTTLNLVLGKDKLEFADVSVSDWTATMLSGVEADPTWALATPLTIEAKEAGAGVRFNIYTEVATNPVYYRTHDGVAWSDWAEYSSGATVTLAKVGDKVQFKGDNAGYAFGASAASTFVFSKDCYVYGNIMSLITSTDFSTCTSLTKTHVFARMFQGNTHLLSHPTQELLLPVMELTEACYNLMFYGCTALETAPKIPAITMARASCVSMFSGCTSLKNVPDLPATTMAWESCMYMFYGCTSMITAPKLAATTLADNCYDSMFRNCTSLTTIPANMLPANKMESGCYKSMFEGCISLITVPDTMLPATTLANSCYGRMFSHCTSLTATPALPASELAISCYVSMFEYCSSLTTVQVLPSTTMVKYCYDGMFSRCTSLTTIPTGMLPATTLADNCYYAMFFGCTSLNSFPNDLLPATNLKIDCYNSMFEGCTSMTAGPILPAEKLVSGCYNEMFAYCSNLSSVTCLANDDSTIMLHSTTDWLKDVAATGILYRSSSCSFWVDHLPSGWTETTYTP